MLIWVGLNWLGIMLESFSFSLNKHKYYQSIRDCIGARSERRLCAFLSTFLLIMSCISCYYFLRGIEVCILAPKIQLDTIYYFLLVCQCYCNKNSIAIFMGRIRTFILFNVLWGSSSHGIQPTFFIS